MLTALKWYIKLSSIYYHHRYLQVEKELRIIASTISTAKIELQKLNWILLLYNPAPALSSSDTTNDPTTILICQWMGISPRSRTLQSIYNRYSTIRPTALILTVRSLPEFYITTPTSSQVALFRLIISALQSDLALNPRLLVHVFSNGGALSLFGLCTMFQSERETYFPSKRSFSILPRNSQLPRELERGLRCPPQISAILVSIGIISRSSARNSVDSCQYSRVKHACNFNLGEDQWCRTGGWESEEVLCL
jgi:hypothetical protein